MPYAVKVARTVWTGGKLGDNFKGLPIRIWNSQSTGGRSALDYLVKIEGMPFQNAVKELVGDIRDIGNIGNIGDIGNIGNTKETQPNLKNATNKTANKTAKTTAQKATTETAEITDRQVRLPPPAPNNDKAIEYLASRGLSKNVAKKAIASGIMYQSINNTCVFIGKDGDKPKYAFERSIDLDRDVVNNTINSSDSYNSNSSNSNHNSNIHNINNTTIKKDVFGSDKRYNFCIPAKDRSSKNLAVFESPIDALAHYELCRLQEKDWDGYRLSLGGVGDTALKSFIERNPNITDIQLCLDADDVGTKACTKITKELIENKMGKGKNISVQKPKKGKDYTEYLQILKSEILTMQSMQTQTQIQTKTKTQTQNNPELHKPQTNPELHKPQDNNIKSKQTPAKTSAKLIEPMQPIQHTKPSQIKKPKSMER